MNSILRPRVVRPRPPSSPLRHAPPTAGANAKLRYQITSGNKGGVFDIEPEVGTIFIAQPLDYEQQKRYKLLVLASDGKWEDYAAVVVTVVNKNDEAPVFSMNEYYGSVTEELDGSPVFVLQVRGGGGSTRARNCLSELFTSASPKALPRLCGVGLFTLPPGIMLFFFLPYPHML